jgi:hypothetical protein
MNPAARIAPNMQRRNDVQHIIGYSGGPAQ